MKESEIKILEAGWAVFQFEFSDLNGDEIIDGSDALLADNNAANFVTVIAQ